MLYHIDKITTALLGYVCVLIGLSNLIWKVTLDSTDIGILFILVGVILIKSCWKWFIEKL